jgi:dihydrofolate reductase
MTRLRVASFGISLDGFGAGPGQSLDNPLGVGGQQLFQWLFDTLTFRRLHGEGEGRTGVDEDFAAGGFENIGAWIMGRNMFGPVRGPWPDESWRGWWDEDPPYHAPVFVLTHHARPPLEMEGGTTFHFVTEGIEAAWHQARAAAQGKDVRLGGGVATVREYLRARLVDELHVALSPVVLGRGENLFTGLDLADLGYRCLRSTAGEKATHLIVARSTPSGE